MKGRQYFLVFFLAIAGSALITVFLDSGTRDWSSYEAESISVHYAVPVGPDLWAIQWIVRSGLPIPYTRVLLYSTETSTGTFLDTFEDQLYPMGFSGNQTVFFKDPSLIEALRESQLSSRLFAPEKIEGDILTVFQDGTTSTASYSVKEGGVPFLCNGALATTSYGNSDTSFYKVEGKKALPWLIVRDEIADVPFCGANGVVYLRSDTQSYSLQDRAVRPLDKTRLLGGFNLDGSWVGVPEGTSCRYVAASSGEAGSEQLVSAVCQENAYFASNWSLLGNEQELQFRFNEDTTAVAGRLVGARDLGFAVADVEKVKLFWLQGEDWMEHTILNRDWIKRLPTRKQVKLAGAE